MAQRILEPGQIETLAQRAIPRVRLPDREFMFARRAARLRTLAAGSALGDYLQFLAVLVDAQHAALAHLAVPMPTTVHIERSGEHGMPPIHAATWPRAPQWRGAVEVLCPGPAPPAGFPARLHHRNSTIPRAPPARIAASATSVRGGADCPLAP